MGTMPIFIISLRFNEEGLPFMSNSLSVLVLTLFALIAFAANSILCRLALGAEQVDPASFTALRLLAGAIALYVCVTLQARQRPKLVFRPAMAGLLFGYAACFSFAYVSMSTGAGALLLFGVVQLTMLLASWLKGEGLTGRLLMGTGFAFCGLVYLLLPGAEAPSLTISILMVVSGVCWGLYSLLGVAASRPLLITLSNFCFSLPLAGLLLIGFYVISGHWQLNIWGALYAIASGAIASGLGYAVWYKALPYLKGKKAASVQLSVPIIAGAGGWIFMAEPLSVRFIIASVAVLGGVYIAISAKK